jgi:hypothetical protein
LNWIIIYSFLSNESFKNSNKNLFDNRKNDSTFSINDEDIPSIDSVSFVGDNNVIVDDTSSLEKVENKARLTRCDCVLSAK